MNKPSKIDRMENIGPAWMESALRAAGIEAKVRTVSSKPIGNGKISETSRLTVEYSEAPHDAPRSFVCKLQSPIPEAHQFAIQTGLYRGEMNAYKAVTAKGSCRIPKLYWVAGEDTWINLLLEDLGAKTEPGDQVKGSDVNDARATLAQLARLHASFFPLSHESAPTWLTRLSDSGSAWSAIINQGALTLLRIFGADLSKTHRNILNQFPEIVPAFYRYPFKNWTLSHGETRVDNVLFDRSLGTVSAVIIDWQNVGLRSPMFDICYFLCGSVSVADRRTNEIVLLDEYARQFAEMAPGYSTAAIESEYRINMLSGLFQTAAGAAFLCPDPSVAVPESTRVFLSTLMDRNLHAVSDWDSASAVLV